MTPRRVAAAVGLFAVGCGVGYRVHRRACEETHIRMYRRLLVAEANQDHELCKATENAMANYIAHQEARLDALEHPGRVVDEAERITREGS